MISPMNSMPKIALMSHNASLAELQHGSAKIQKLTEVEQINLENEWTEFLKNLVEYGNTHYLKSFALRLEME